MESNKENVKKSPPKSRIPLPLRPISTQSNKNLQSFANRNLITSEAKFQRHPLKTIDHHNIHCAGPSKVNVVSKLKPSYISMKHVTFREKNYAEKKNANTVTINDDNKNFVHKNHCDCLSKVKITGTPMIPRPLGENIRIRNIKKSLKRPHSRELLGISPQYKQDKNNYDKLQIRYKEVLQDRLNAPDFVHRSYMTCLAKDYVTDMFNYLLEAERKPLDIPRIKNVTRSCLINWIIKVNGIDGQTDTVQTACWYLDSVLGTGLVDEEKLQLVAAACYWIAQKLHRPSMTASDVVKCANMTFTCQNLIEAERAVLLKLNFPPQPVVPQDFINYLAWWCDSEYPGEIEMAATFLCISGLMVDKAVCQDYPSIIAVAAVKNALLLLKRRHLINRLMMCPIYKAVETKAAHFGCTCSILRRAVRTVASQDYEFKAPYEQFGFPPWHIAQKIVNAVMILHETEKNNL